MWVSLCFITAIFFSWSVIVVMLDSFFLAKNLKLVYTQTFFNNNFTLKNIHYNIKCDN